jgi:hypothetical protein
MNRYPEETNEYAPVSVLVNQVAPVYTDVEFAVTIAGNRPTGVDGGGLLGSWMPAIHEGSTFGIQIHGYGLGEYQIWARVFNNTDTPVIEVDGFFIV